MRVRCGFLAAVVLPVLQSADAQIVWQRVWGPAPVTVESIVFDRHGHGFAATSGLFFSGRGILRSTDAGMSWVAANTGLTDTNVSALLVAPNGDILAGVWTMGSADSTCVFRSSDDGNTWSRLDSGLAGATVCWSIMADSTGDIFVGVQGGASAVWRSADDGDSWVPTTPFTPNGCNALAVHPDGTIFAGTLLTGMFRTTDKGDTWEEINNGLTNRFVYELLVTPQGVVFAGTGGFFSTGVFRSTDRGTSWVQTALDSVMISALAWNADGTIFAGTYGAGVFSSTDNGDSWVEVNSGLTHFHVTSLAISPVSFLFAGTDSGGIFRSTNPIVSVSEEPMGRPVSCRLFQNYPNPFNPVTSIKFRIQNSEFTTLKVFDLLGRELTTLVNEIKDPGSYTVRWNASGQPSGVYLYRLQAGNFVQTKRMIVLK